MIKKSFLLIAAFLLVFFSASAQKKNVAASSDKQMAAIGFYNLENLFDTIDDPNTNDQQHLPDGDYQWNTERYQRKLTNMSYTISQIAKEYGGVVALGVSEIENEAVLLDLCKQPSLKKLNLGVVHHDSPDRRGVDVALLYQKDRFRVLEKKPYRLYTADTSFRTRDQLLVKGIVDGTDTVHIIVNHWPSKLGGEQRSMPKRIAAAELSKHITDSITKVNPYAKVFIMGDLNDNPNAKSIMTILRPAKNPNKLLVGGLYNPMYKLYMDGIWSYVYRDEPNVIDQIIVSYGVVYPKNGYRFVRADIFRANFLLTKSGSYEGTPFRTYAAGTYLGGYSDHLPVYVLLEK